ncbi:Ca2+ regulator and membrane fusion protein Fig1-domain-containing protein [Lipomyces arxii]|uniref:Ca2+ regulator and membrane fusion protein Fig1-domain-containing protein n=1 Tax=Lipomyces arxii TaxID=56418 RepID=UPI0034CF4A72
MASFNIEFLSISFIRPRHIFQLFLLSVIIITSLLLAGCSTSFSFLPQIYLLNIGYNDGTVYQPVDPTIINQQAGVQLANIALQTAFEVRVGYFALCINAVPGSWLCSQNATSLAEQLSPADDPFNVLHVAAVFHDTIMFPYLLICSAGLSFVIFVFISPSPPVMKTLTVITGYLAATMILISVLWQHVACTTAASTIVNQSNGTLFTSIGKIAVIFGWLSFGLLTLTVAGVYLYIKIERVAQGFEDIATE